MTDQGCPELEDHDCRNDQLPVNPETVPDLLLQLDPYKCMGPGGIHSGILKDLGDVITQPLSMIFEQSWEYREVPADWKLVNVLIFKQCMKKPRNYRLSQCPLRLAGAGHRLAQITHTAANALRSGLQAGQATSSLWGLGSPTPATGTDAVTTTAAEKGSTLSSRVESVVVEKVQDASPPVSRKASREKFVRKGKGKKEEEKPKEVIQVTPTVQEEINLENSHWLPPPDFILMDYINNASRVILPLTTTREQIVALAQFVADKMGGSVEREQLHNFCWELDMSAIEFELKSNIVPIGKIKKGTFYHRALLFKVIADRIGIGCSLVRGKYNRAWNEVHLVEHSPKGLLLPPQAYIVDLMFEPGCLLKQGTAKADRYKFI
ncbi:hypothetical protein DUI87_18066 [Hirundo rustica rustica]|uniref:EDR1/CTR1/ARMC3-like peptidase-like domain-containing protein n=1 Tax=Hirundo rustica rustica TaxID=333673 RepID=A0A3M0JXK0_HIRRU|nr:hypothetical protein DUI87_18066 [Hirundo rustica rustica]